MKPAKINCDAVITSGVFKGYKEKVVAAEFHDGIVLVKIRLDKLCVFFCV